MTDEQRVEAAARVLGRHLHLRIPADDELQIYMPAARDILRASYPELHGDKPSHWLAPWEASEEMLTAAENSPHGDSYHYAAPRHQWPAMRTAHLAKDQE